MLPDTDDDDDDDGDEGDEGDRDRDDGLIYTSWNPNNFPNSLRARLFRNRTSARDKPKCITTTPGLLGAGETETEADEPVSLPLPRPLKTFFPCSASQPRRLPTARIIPASPPLVPPNTLQQRLTPLLFESSRLLSIVPAVLGILYNLYQAYNPSTVPLPPDSRRPPERIDRLVAALWVSTPSPILLSSRIYQPTQLPPPPKGNPHRLPVSLPHHRPPHPLALLLPAPPDTHTPPRPPGNLLARHARHALPPRPRAPPRRYLGGRWHHDVCESLGADMGHE